MTNQTLLAPGTPAPDVMLLTASSGQVHLSAEWEAAPEALVLVFLRHFG